MLIVSQDRDVIINSDNIEVLGIGNPLEDDDGKFKILANTTSDSQYTIAKYDTEERATKVLQEIIERYEHTQYIKSFGREIDCYEVGIKDFAYEMPKE